MVAAEQLAVAVDDKWVNVGVVGDEYFDFVKAGRPNT